MLEKDHPEIPLKMQAELLGISYSSLFYEPVPPSARELAIKRRIDELYTACPFYGSRKIAFLLRPEFGVSRPTVQAYMRDMGIFALVPGPHTSTPAPEHPIYPYLLRNVTATHPNHIWGIDITYIRHPPSPRRPPPSCRRARCCRCGRSRRPRARWRCRHDWGHGCSC